METLRGGEAVIGLQSGMLVSLLLICSLICYTMACFTKNSLNSQQPNVIQEFRNSVSNFRSSGSNFDADGLVMVWAILSFFY